MAGMPDNTAAPRPVRDVADGYVRAQADLDPFLATTLGLATGQDRMPDLSPAGQDARDDLIRSTLAALDALPGEPADGDERRCARLLRERLGARLAMSEAGEHLREVSNVFGPLHRVRDVFTLMPTGTAEDWAVVARRMSQVPAALDGYRASLAEGMSRGLLAGRCRRPRWPGSSPTGWPPGAGRAGTPSSRPGPTCPPRCGPTWTRPGPARRPRWPGCGPGWRPTTCPGRRRPPTAPARSGTCARPGSGPALTWTWPRCRSGAGPSTGGCATTSPPRPGTCCPAPRRPRRCATWTRTARPSTGWSRSGSGCRR